MSKSKGNKVVQTIAPIVGSSVTTVAAASGAGVVSPIIGRIVQNGFEELLSRLISRRQAERINEGRDYILMRIESKKKDGNFIQNPMFQEENIAEAEEVLEGVLLKVMSEHEQKKAQYIANLFVNLPFEPDVNITGANQMLKDIDSLTYGDLCIIAAWKRKITLIDFISAEELEKQDHYHFLLTNRALRLVNMEIIHRKARISDNVFKVIPDDMMLTKYGEKLYLLFELSLMEEQDVRNTIISLCSLY